MTVSRSGHLVALKVLAGRPQDQEDVRILLREIDPKELQLARQTLLSILRMITSVADTDIGRNLKYRLALGAWRPNGGSNACERRKYRIEILAPVFQAPSKARF